MTHLKPLAMSFGVTLFLASAPLRGQATIPNTPAGKVLRAWVDAYNSDDSVRVAMFFRAYSVEDALRGAFAFRKMTGGLDLLSIQVSEPRHVEFMTRFRRGPPMVGYGALDVSAADTSRVSGYFFPLGMNVSVDDIRIDAPTRERVVGRLAALLDSFYVSPEVGKRMSDSLHARLGRGVYDKYTNGATLAIHLRADLDEIAHDKHLQILYTRLIRGPAPPPKTASAERESEANCPVWTTQRLDGNIGYLRFDGFVDPAECPSTIVTAMTALAGTSALIIDLRENAGGGVAGSTPLLESYLFDRRTHLSDVSFRYTGEIRERWTLDSVAGARFGGQKPVYLLTSAHTLSAAEELAYDLQALKRATIVGETTSGQAHATFEARIDDHFEILLPSGRTLNPVTGADWEGVGVVPDVKVPASDALSTAQRLLREKLAH